MSKTADPLPRLMHECFLDLLFSIMVGAGLLMVSVVSSASINATMKFQQDLQHQEYNQLAQVILKEAYRRIGHPIASSHGQRIAQDGNKKDGILIAPADSRKKNDYIRIPVAIVKLKVFAYVHENHGSTRYEFGLLSNRIAIVQGMAIVQNNMMGMIALQKNSVNTSFQSILRNQVDLALIPEFSALKQASKHLRKHIVPLHPAVYEVPMYHYVTKKHEHLVESLTRSLKSMQKQQLITQVTKSYKTILAADAEA
jgi:polar amino acid transport system substrate-binding protein